tara:strand:+ start:1255 stop:1746 length:492 start_codon:yes stop_codon:yes gene_type:complete
MVLWYSTTKGYKNNVEVVSYYNDNIKSSSKNISIPSVIRLTRYYNFFRENIKFCRKNIFIRDNYTCQYCGKKSRRLTYDHVIPKSKWPANSRSKATDWLNITTACLACNLKKGDRTPQQAKMPLLRKPYAPSKNEKYLPIAQYLLTIKEVPEEWMQYVSHFVT